MSWIRRVLFTGCLGLATGPRVTAEPVRFNRDIRPFLSDTCFKCHGPDAKTREADLRLDDETAAKSEIDGHATIVAGDPSASEAMRRILTTDREEQMPPPDSGLTLTSEQKALFQRWIQEGAVYEKHWSLEPIRRPPSQGNAVDFFIRRKLKEAGIAPSPAATAETQLRRLSLDLTGLPPSLAELDAFLAQAQAQGLDAAYEAAADRLLRSPRHAEHWAWYWLEAARYADTDGYQNDGPREMWRWRDWVISAFQANLPFDQFTIEQLAGDLLPKPTHQQLIATAFNRNHRYNSEEGIPIDEFLLENAVDRVDTTSTVWMGVTMGCARCHDHKYDPFSQKEYYQLIDYFNDVAESGRAVKVGNSEPWIKTPTDEQRRRLRQLSSALQRNQTALKNAEPDIAAAAERWAAQQAAPTSVLNEGLDFHYSFDQETKNVQAKTAGATQEKGPKGRAAIVRDEGWFELDKVPGLIGNGRFSIAFWMNPSDVQSGPVLSNEMPGTGRNGVLVEFADGHLRWNNITRWISGVSTIETRQNLTAGEWVHVTLTNDGTQRADGMQIYLNGRRSAVNVIRNTNSNTAKRDQGTAMRIGYSVHAGHWSGALADLRFYTTRTLNQQEAQLLAVNLSPTQIAQIPQTKRTLGQTARLRQAYLEHGGNTGHTALLKASQEAEAARIRYLDSLPTTMIMRDLPQGRPSFVRERGVYDALGEAVQPGVPAALPPLPEGEKNDRLSFARWLVNGRHPLTARVAANRCWQLVFGCGLVDTAEDFGSQGHLPSHPELLDWLAAELMDSGWDQRHLIKTLVMSQTYRQTSASTAPQRRADPDNILLSHAPRPRLPGNVLRDQALLISGLLVEKIGGPSVYPYQPKGLWEEASNARYTEGKGEDLYRRSLYTYWKRTLAPPSMAVLDTGDREYCTVKPKRTNTPLQALTLMNEITFVEAARKFAERMLLEGGEKDVDRITFAFRTATSRRPQPEELQVLQEALKGFRAEFRQNPSDATALPRTGASPAAAKLDPIELAAHAALANVLLNLDEVTSRE
ncbi:MAG: DUF1553 domain-containing protein [Verrucomicrobiales bacterium]|nr:DUF1553 domain-containing protein [Verrucomicrobiales bacterium]